MVHVTLLLSTTLSSIKKNRRLWVIVAFGILLLFAVLRYDFGSDYFSYYKNFKTVHSGGEPYTNEPLFLFIFKMCPSFSFFIAITSVFTVLPVYCLIRHFVDRRYCCLSVLIYCINPYLYLMSLSAIRQALALSFFIIAIFYSLKNKLIPYLFFVALAAMCHITALILFPAFIIANDKKVSRGQVAALAACVLFVLLSENIFTTLMQYGLDFFSNPNFVYYTTSGGNTLRATLLSSVYFIYILINIPRLEGTTLAFAKLSAIGYIFAIFAYRYSILTRLQTYFDIFTVISIPMIMFHNKMSFRSRNKMFYVTNMYALPILIFTIYVLRYYSFFTNPLWKSFREYHTVLSPLKYIYGHYCAYLL